MKFFLKGKLTYSKMKNKIKNNKYLCRKDLILASILIIVLDFLSNILKIIRKIF